MVETKAEILTRAGIEISAIEVCLNEAMVAAAAETVPRFRSGLAVDNKLHQGFDPVTEADKNAELAIRDVISRHFPDHGIIGEEHDNVVSQSGFDWIIDPVDGTRSFIAGVPLWGTLIGLAHEGRVIAGGMGQPYIGETFLGLPGRSLMRRGDTELSLRSSGQTDLSRSRLFTTALELFDTPEKMAVWTNARDEALLARMGCDCYAYCLLAAGHADLIIEPGMNVYDIAALIPIMEEAGGAVANWDGGAADRGGDIVAAASPELLDKALELIARVRG